MISKIDYCNALLVNLPDCVMDKLQALMNAAARVVTCTPRHNHITGVLKRLHWLPVKSRVNHKVLTITYKALHDEAPDYLRELVQWYEPNRNLRSADTVQLCVPHVKNKYGERCFSYAAPTLWNRLPKHIKLSKNTSTFEKRLKTHLFRQYHG